MEGGAGPILDCLIVGGGPHGIHLAVRLLHAGAAPHAVRILDPHAAPLARWKSYTGNTGMSHLRSPQVHNLGVDALALTDHAASAAFRLAQREACRPQLGEERDFIPPYKRPSLRLFMHHAQSLVERFDLMRQWHRGRAESLHRIDGGFRLVTTAGDVLEAKNVVLALGAGDQLRLPAWAKEAELQDPQVPLDHIFAPGFQRSALGPSEDVLIVGAGIYAAQLALALADRTSQRRVTMLSRHSFRAADFESDPGWLGPTFLQDFDAEPCLVKRRAMIQEARELGSLAAEVMFDISQAIRAGHVTHSLAHIDKAEWDAVSRRILLRVRAIELDEEAYHRTGEIVSRIRASSHWIAADRVVVATGFESERPGGALVSAAIDELGLPVAPDAFPILDRYLRWCSGLFVMGPLAELVIGPASRNLSGARMAATRILECPEMRSLSDIAAAATFRTC